MVEEFTKNGGTLKLNTQVNRIRCKNGSVSGVILKDGTEIACNHIICSTSPTTTYAKLMKSKDVPVSAVKRTNARTFGARYACVYLGLNRSAKDLGIKDYSVFINETADTAEQYTLMKSIDTNNSLRAICPNIINADASPLGTTILRLSTIYTDNCWADVSPEEYFDAKDMLAARLIAKYETATGITIHNSIEELEVVTPVTFARYTASPQGVTHGYLADDWDSIIPRIMTEETDCDIKGLRFCSAWGTQLNGINAVVATGRNAAYATLCDISEEGGNA
jgi:prolycopene isomerase